MNLFNETVLNSYFRSFSLRKILFVFFSFFFNFKVLVLVKMNGNDFRFSYENSSDSRSLTFVPIESPYAISYSLPL